MVSKSQMKAQEKYDARMAIRYCLKLNRGTDADIIERLTEVSQTEGKQGYIKRLIRQDIDHQ